MTILSTGARPDHDVEGHDAEDHGERRRADDVLPSEQTPRPVEVRRHAGLLLATGIAASALAIAFLWRATGTGRPLDIVLCAALALLGAWNLAGLLDARTPLMVADDLGVRIRLGRQWRGLPWSALERVVVADGDSPWQDRRLALVPHDLAHAVEGVEGGARRSLLMTQRVYGAPLALPLGLTTRVAADRPLVDALVALAAGRTDVVVVTPESRESFPPDGITLLPSRAPRPETATEDDTSADSETGAEPGETHVALREAPAAEDLDEAPGDTAATDSPAGAPAGGLEVLSSFFGQRRRREPVADEADHDLEPVDSVEPVQPLGTVGDRDEARDPMADGAAEAPAASLVGGHESEEDGRDLPEEPAATAEESDAVETEDEATAEGETDGGATEPAATRRTLASAIGSLSVVVERVGKRREHAGEQAVPAESPALDRPAAASWTDPTEDTPPGDAAAEALAARPAARRVEVTHTTEGAAARDLDSDDFGVHLLPEGAALRPGTDRDVFDPREDTRPGRAEGVTPIQTGGHAVAPLVLGDYETRPAYDPVIGPQLAAVRTRLGMSVDELADRTRIRPHVIESIEVDDFAPCGGDFYARGHLRTLARLLGRDGEALVALFDERYATGTVNARRVFEAELAAGMTGSMRKTARSGPHWGLVAGLVLAVGVFWGAARMAVDTPDEVVVPAPLPGLTQQQPAADPAAAPADPVRLVLRAAASADVTVRDATGEVVFSGPVSEGDVRRMQVQLPVRVRSSDGAAVAVRIDGTQRQSPGAGGEPGSRRYR